MSIIDFVVLKAPELLGIEGLPTARFGAEVNYFSGAEAWSAALVNKFADATAAMEQTGITAEDVDAMTVERGRSAMTEMFGFVTNAAGRALDAIAKGDMSATFEIPVSIAKDALVAVWAYNANGVYLHTEGAFARGIQAGRISEDDAMRHAWRCAAIFDAIVGMRKKGALDWAGQAKPVNGLGLTGGEVLILIAAGVIAALVQIAFIYILMQSFNQAVVQKRALDQCDKLLEEGKTEEHQKCMQNVLAASNEGTNNLMDNIATGANVVIWTVVIGIVGIVAVQVAPVLMSKIGRTREA